MRNDTFGNAILAAVDCGHAPHTNYRKDFCAASDWPSFLIVNGRASPAMKIQKKRHNKFVLYIVQTFIPLLLLAAFMTLVLVV